MRLKLGVLALGLIAALAGCRHNAPNLIIRRLPGPYFDPPGTYRQHPEPAARAWIPPRSHLPPEFVQAVRFLQSHGMGDPRGGQFCAANTESALTWQGLFVEQPVWHGWEIRQPDGKLGFVCEDGLSYSLVSVLRPVGFDAYALVRPEVRSSFVLVRRFREDPCLLLSENSDDTADDPDPLESSVRLVPSIGILPKIRNDEFVRTPSPEMVAALALVYGRVDLAEKILPTNLDPRTPPILTLGRVLLRAKWIRALDAYARGDDESALELCRDIVSLRPEYDKAIREAFVRAGIDAQLTADWFPFLSQAKALVAETQRRNRAPGKTPPLKASNLAIFVRYLIGALDQESLPFSNASRHVSLEASRVGKGPPVLLQLGPRAMPAMIEDLDGDDRLTRQIVRSASGLRIVSVREYLLRIINTVSGASFHPDRNGRMPTTKFIRAWWERTSKLTPAEREYDLLADDSQDPLQWVFAAKQISGYLTLQPGFSTVELKWSNLRLKVHQNPSVTDLLVRRIKYCLSDAGPDSLLAAKVLFACLNRWDPDHASRALMPLSDRLLQVDRTGDAGPHLTVFGSSYKAMDPELPELLERRLDLGDRSVLGAYRAVLLREAVDPGTRSANYSYFFRHRDEPEFKGLSKELFVDSVGHRPDPADPFSLPLAVKVIESPLFNLPEEQDAVIRMLQDKSLFAIATRTPDSTVMRAKGATLVVPYRNREPDDPLGQTWKERVCDQVAVRILPEGDDRFRTYWPLPKRDAILSSLITKLRRHPKNMWPDDSAWP